MLLAGAVAAKRDVPNKVIPADAMLDIGADARRLEVDRTSAARVTRVDRDLVRGPLEG
jgi:hypothetical protein